MRENVLILGFQTPYTQIRIYRTRDIMNPLYIEPIAVSLERLIQLGPTVSTKILHFIMSECSSLLNDFKPNE